MLNLKGKQLPEFVNVTNIKRSVLPPIQNHMLKVRGKAGAYHYGQTVDIRTIEVDIAIISDGLGDVANKASVLAEWLRHKEPVDLFIDDQPDRYYKVLHDGSSDIDEIVSVGKGTITFILTEPYAYGASHTLNFTPVSGVATNIDVVGNGETYPDIKLMMKEDVTDISVVSDDQFVHIGEYSDITQTAVDSEPTRLHDQMADPLNWTSAISVDDGEIAGEFESNGYSMHVKDGDFGTPENYTAWHGASGIQSLDRPVDNFEVEMRFGFNTEHAEDIGKIELYLLDSNNEQFGKIKIQDADPSRQSQRFLARAGIATGGTNFIDDFGEYKGVWKNMKQGLLKIARNGNQWSAYIGIYDEEKGIYHTQLYDDWTDQNEKWTNQLAKVQIHIATHSTYNKYDVMNIQDIRVVERQTLGDSQTPIIAKQNDIILIDNASATIYKNGVEFFEGLNPSSKFISLQKGNNGLVVAPAKADVELTYLERWL
ncbi:distal tail protein Dit [Halobacillus karajensis]|uniref:distal tail protein Dit n=1 Tax=Halobacillus karajensis TaxID=195088 RepID=UPI00045CEC1B|nr:distal tail protein Dit [Halobacillus karajensis]CDQ21710.1 hypothetical protein BN982_04119 [Halobacillus karajensis]